MANQENVQANEAVIPNEAVASNFGLGDNYAEGFIERIKTGELTKLVLDNHASTDYLTKDYSEGFKHFMSMYSSDDE